MWILDLSSPPADLSKYTSYYEPLCRALSEAVGSLSGDLTGFPVGSLVSEMASFQSPLKRGEE